MDPGQPHWRAQLLLRSHLSNEQLRSWRAEGYFVAIGEMSHVPYVLSLSAVYVRVADLVFYFCAIPGYLDWVPESDVILTKKLLIEKDEASFLATAHRSCVYDLSKLQAAIFPIPAVKVLSRQESDATQYCSQFKFISDYVDAIQECEEENPFRGVIAYSVVREFLSEL